MTAQTHSPEGDKPLYQESGFWTQCVLPLLMALGIGVGVGGIVDHETKDWEKQMQSSDTTITSPVELNHSSSIEVR
jgi:hypothetical protein